MIREFTCQKCGSWETDESMNHPLPKHCPTCHGEITQTYSTNIQCNFIDASSHMCVEKADMINRKFMSKELMEKEIDKDPIYGARKRAKKNKPFWDSDGVDLKKVKDTQKYIDEGQL